MTTMLVALAVVAVIVAALLGWVGWRDRQRTTSGDDAAAGRDARARQQRYEAERHGSQGDTWQRGQHESR